MATETEAVSKYCPQTMTHPAGYGRCIASDCMAWRWMPEAGGRMRIYCPDRYATVEEGMTRPARAATWEFAPWDGDDYPAQWLEPEAEYLARRRGYCGLAGKP